MQYSYHLLRFFHWYFIWLFMNNYQVWPYRHFLCLIHLSCQYGHSFGLKSGTSRQNSRGFGETCLIPPWWGQRGQVMFARCGTLNSLEFFFSVRNTMCGGSAWLKTEMSDCHAQCMTLESPALLHANIILSQWGKVPPLPSRLLPECYVYGSLRAALLHAPYAVTSSVVAATCSGP